MRKLSVLIFTIIQLLLISAVFAQNNKPVPLTEKDLEKYTYYFDIADNKFSGKGTQFLIDELNKNQYVMLGEYHDSARISEFTKAFIPLADNAGFHLFAFEVGPVTAEIMTEMSKDSAKTVGNFRDFNSKYAIRVEGKKPLMPIPFFKNVEDAEFLREAAQRKWNFIGLDQELIWNYLPLLDRIYKKLNSKKKKELKALYEASINQIKGFYVDDLKEDKYFLSKILESKEIRKFLEKASEKNPKNKEIADAFIKTTEIYEHNEKRRYWANNSERIAYMKENLRRGMTKFSFNLQKDKMLVKMGGFHTGRGFTPVAQYDVGNTLSELAAFNGNKSVNIYFDMRFYINGKGEEVDALTDEKGWAYNYYRSLLQMGKKDQWTVIDLRPLRPSVFYAKKYDLTEQSLDVFRRYDLIIIPKIENEAKPNYDN